MCYDGDHGASAKWLGVFLLAIYVVGFPALTAVLIYLRTKKWKKYDLHFGFLYAGLKPGIRLYWELWVMLKKLMVSAVIVYMPASGKDSPGTQVVAVSFIILLGGLVLTWAAPYKTETCDIINRDDMDKATIAKRVAGNRRVWNAEKLAHQVLVATLFCVILTYAKIADDGSVVQDRFQESLAFVIVFINTAFMMYIATKSGHTRPWIFTPVTKAKSVKRSITKKVPKAECCLRCVGWCCYLSCFCWLQKFCTCCACGMKRLKRGNSFAVGGHQTSIGNGEMDEMEAGEAGETGSVLRAARLSKMQESHGKHGKQHGKHSANGTNSSDAGVDGLSKLPAMESARFDTSGGGKDDDKGDCRGGRDTFDVSAAEEDSLDDPNSFVWSTLIGL